jgi:murein DD-endopeptidase MepM/ murein hydrolase activator NlpD
MQANGLTSAAIRPGQRLVIPRYNATMNNATARAPAANAVAATPARPQATGTSGVHVVAPGETLFKLSRTYGKPVADIARANNLPAHATLKIGDRMVIPGARTPSGTRTTTLPAEGKPLAKQSPKPAPVVQPAETQQASVVTPTNDLPAPAAAAKTAEGPPSFRWPVKGRVIAAFGPKPNGQQNDGINVSVPEGTPIKAAEDGVVAYAGNELKGYGNLVLIRHANGYVTAYAHAKELQVKRGDQIKRGQVIGKAGQTGNVDAPQLHFEVRKGPTPLDPMPMLSGG